MRFLIGIDEAGRAPLAGPVSVGLVMVPEGFDVAHEFPGVRDSKKLSEKKREEIYALLERRVASGDVRFCVRFSTHGTIDRVGITRAVHRAVAAGVRFLDRSYGSYRPSQTYSVHVLLDGLLHAPREFSQETIIRGDDLVPLISLASIAAKVERDRLMHKMAAQYPEYGFERHVGYPTVFHRAMLVQYGLTPIHRRSFCKKYLAVE